MPIKTFLQDSVGGSVQRLVADGDDTEVSFDDGSVKCLKDDRNEIMALGTFDLFESLDVIVFGPVHNGEYLCHETGFTA